VVVQAMPAGGPRSQVPVPGLLGVPVAEHLGQGWARLPVRCATPLPLSITVSFPPVSVKRSVVCAPRIR